MRSLILMLTLLGHILGLAWSGPVPVQQAEQEHVAAETLLDVDSGVDGKQELVRPARQFYGYYGRPLYGGYYGSYGYPYYGGYGFGGPYYYGGYYRPYYGIYGGFYG